MFYDREDCIDDLKSERKAERIYQEKLTSHPDCNAPDHPGCTNCEVDFVDKWDGTDRVED